MRIYLKIAFSLTLLLFSTEVISQEEQKVIQIDSQDDLGNVDDAFQENFFEALKQKAIENHEKAIDALIKCLAIDASNAAVFLELGKNYNALEEYEEARTYLEKARSAEPENEAVLAELYQTYFLNNQFEKALPVVEELAAVNEGFSEDLANLYVINEKYDSALELLNDLDEQWGNSSYRNMLRNQIYAKTGNIDAHIQDLERKIEEDPKEEQNYLNLIFVYSEEGNTDKAFGVAKKLQEIIPASELVHLALYKFHLTDEDSEEALNSMEVIFRSEEIDKETKFKVLNDFLIYVSQNPDLEEELVEIVKLFSEDEESPELYGKLGLFYLELNKQAQALKFFELALLGEIKDFILLKNTLSLQLELERSREARQLSERALENFPSQPLLYLYNGTALNQLGEFKEAEEMLTFGLDYLIEDLPLELEFYRQLAVAYAGLKNEEKAVQFQKMAAELEKKTIDE